MQVRSLGHEDPPEKEMASHCGILVWKIPWMEEPGRPQSNGSQRVEHAWATEKKKRVNIVFDWAVCGSYLQKEHLKESCCFSQLVAVNWGMWNVVQVSMWKAPLKTEMLERWRLTLVRSQRCLSGPTLWVREVKCWNFAPEFIVL